METSYGWHPPKHPAPVVGKLLSAVRYLGPYLSVHVDMNVEIRKRIVAANMNFVDFARVLKSSKTPQFGTFFMPHYVLIAIVYGSTGA